jgi:hypothetical protein
MNVLKSTIRSIPTHHRQNPTEVIYQPLILKTSFRNTRFRITGLFFTLKYPNSVYVNLQKFSTLYASSSPAQRSQDPIVWLYLRQFNSVHKHIYTFQVVLPLQAFLLKFCTHSASPPRILHTISTNSPLLCYVPFDFHTWMKFFCDTLWKMNLWHELLWWV